MKKIAILITLLLTLLVSSFVVAKHAWRGDTMSSKEVCQRWGEKDFNADQFKAGDASVKASFACSLLKKQKQYRGLPLSEVRSTFGDYSGYYFSDMYPVYIIQRGKDRTEDTWQLVFLLTKDYQVSEIIVHKNCCDR